MAAAACLVVGAGLALGRAVEVARTQRTTGKVTVRSGGKVVAVNQSTEFKPGDLLVLDSASRMTVEFADQSSISLVGPARLQFVQLDETGRRVKLESGVITRAFVRGVALGIQTPYDAEFVLQNATGYARVIPGDKINFQRLDGDFAKVFRGGKWTDVQKTWALDLRGAGAAPGAGDAGTAATSRGADVATMRVGGSQVTFLPAAEFKREDLADGGVRLTYAGEDFGRVELGSEALVFLGPGEYIEFDARGQVVTLTGVSQVFHPIDGQPPYDNPFDGIADASASRPRRR